MKMAKELPENWEGTFFGDEEARQILNITAEEFVRSLLANNPKDAKFFLAGAAFDFGWHGQREKADELIKAASKEFKAPYEKIMGMIDFGKEQIALGLEESNVKSAIYSLIGEMFQDRMKMTMVLGSGRS